MGDLEVILETAPTCHIPTETEVLTSTEPTSTDTLDSGSEENGNDDDDDIEVRPITPKEVLCALDTVRRFDLYADLGEAYITKVNSLIAIVKKEQLKNMRQTTLDSFFETAS